MTTSVVAVAIVAAVLLFAWVWSLCRAAADRLTVREDDGEYE